MYYFFYNLFILSSKIEKIIKNCIENLMIYFIFYILFFISTSVLYIILFEIKGMIEI